MLTGLACKDKSGEGRTFAEPECLGIILKMLTALSPNFTPNVTPNVSICFICRTKSKVVLKLVMNSMILIHNSLCFQ